MVILQEGMMEEDRYSTGFLEIKFALGYNIFIKVLKNKVHMKGGLMTLRSLPVLSG